MKAPNLPSFRHSRPVPQAGQTRGLGRRRLREEVRAQRLVELVEHLGDAQVLGLADGGGEVAFQNSRSSAFQSISPAETSSSSSSRSAVKSYST